MRCVWEHNYEKYVYEYSYKLIASIIYERQHSKYTDVLTLEVLPCATV